MTQILSVVIKFNASDEAADEQPRLPARQNRRLYMQINVINAKT
jgi:hypothetical protein